MTKQDYDIIQLLNKNSYKNQRDLSQKSGFSLGSVNSSIKKLTSSGYINENGSLNAKAKAEIKEKSPKNAIILAAGYGMRMVPFNTENPKGLLEVNGERLIERLICQLHDAGINSIQIVVGFQKEKYEYLIDKYNVSLIVNNSYSFKNNYYSLFLASDYLNNTYIVPCDIWCAENPFNETELYSWYMISDIIESKSFIRHNIKMEIVPAPKFFGGNKMIGIAYFDCSVSALIKTELKKCIDNPVYDDLRWERVLFNKQKMKIFARLVSHFEFIDINTYEQLRDLNKFSKAQQLKSDALQTIANVFNITTDEIKAIKVLKKGMTNRSFLFSCKGAQYIMRIPGEGTDKLINRQHEAEVYKAISGLKLCDNPIYINPENGYKITKYIKNAREANPNSIVDIKLCMRKLRAFHEMKLKVGFEFDLFKEIDFHEQLWNGKKSAYEDYENTKKNVFSLKPFVEKNAGEKCLTHIDAVPDNFLFDLYKIGELSLQLTDWEYAAMQDPHVDIAMFCIYSFYDKKHVDKIIDTYFNGKCSNTVRAKIYCYISICGLLWSNWCEYKKTLGIEFGEYSLRQYRYAKDYYRYAVEEIAKCSK